MACCSQVRLQVFVFIRRLGDRQADGLAKRQARAVRVFDGIGDAHDAETAETVEFAVAGVGRQGSEIDGHMQACAFDRPENGLARPCVATLQQLADLAVPIEVVAFGYFTEGDAGNIRRCRPDSHREFIGYLAEATIGIDLPDETHGAAVRIEDKTGGAVFGFGFGFNVSGISLR